MQSRRNKNPPEPWVALELTSKGETEKNINILVGLIKRAYVGCEMFVPIYYENEDFFEKNIYLLKGYIFIKHDPKFDYYQLKDSKYFNGAVFNPSTYCIDLIPEEDINKLKDQFNDLVAESFKVRKGQTVKILDGLYKNLTGTVKKVIKKKQSCIIKITNLKSRKIEVSAPLMGVSVIDDGELDSTPVTFLG